MTVEISNIKATTESATFIIDYDVDSSTDIKIRYSKDESDWQETDTETVDGSGELEITIDGLDKFEKYYYELLED